MLTIKLKEKVDNAQLPVLNELLFDIIATSEFISAIKITVSEESIIEVINGGAKFYSNSSGTAVIGTKFKWSGSLEEKLWIKVSDKSTIRISSKFDITWLGGGFTGILEDKGITVRRALNLNIDQLAGSTKLTHAYATYAMNIFGNIEAYKNNSLEVLACQETGIIGDLFAAISNSAATLKTVRCHYTDVDIVLDNMSAFNLEAMHLSRKTRGDIKFLKAQNIYAYTTLSEGNEIVYTGNSPISNDLQRISILAPIMDDGNMVRWMRDMSLSTWVAYKVCTLYFKNENNQILDIGGNIINSDVISYTNALKTKGVTVTINGTIR